MTREDIKDICYGRDDLLAVAEKICEESGLSGADGEMLCEELARTAITYLDWVDEPVEETNYRTFPDTQIYKEYRNGKCEISNDEWAFIRANARTGVHSDGYRYNDDKANGYIAFSFSKVNQMEDENWGNDFVDRLNQICENWGEEADWYLGDVNEEYIFVD